MDHIMLEIQFPPIPLKMWIYFSLNDTAVDIVPEIHVALVVHKLIHATRWRHIEIDHWHYDVIELYVLTWRFFIVLFTTAFSIPFLAYLHVFIYFVIYISFPFSLSPNTEILLCVCARTRVHTCVCVSLAVLSVLLQAPFTFLLYSWCDN